MPRNLRIALQVYPIDECHIRSMPDLNCLRSRKKLLVSILGLHTMNVRGMKPRYTAPAVGESSSHIIERRTNDITRDID